MDAVEEEVPVDAGDLAVVESFTAGWYPIELG